MRVVKGFRHPPSTQMRDAVRWPRAAIRWNNWYHADCPSCVHREYGAWAQNAAREEAPSRSCVLWKGAMEEEWSRPRAGATCRVAVNLTA